MSCSRVMESKVALITGASRGLGWAAADCFASAGCDLVLTARHLPEVEKAADRIREQYKVRSLAITCDVSDHRSVHDLFVELRKWSGDRLDALVCNAGYPFQKDIWETPLHETPADKLAGWYEEVFQTDTLGSLYCTYEALPIMMAAKSGSIVYVASIPALEGLQGSPYTIAKAGVLGLMKDVACVYGKFNIRANALAFGSFMTPATLQVMDEEARTAIARETPLGRWGLPGEAAEAMLFLASPQSAFITGQTLVVDGGIVRR